MFVNRYIYKYINAKIYIGNIPVKNLIFCNVAGCRNATLLKWPPSQIFFKSCANNFVIFFLHFYI